MCRCGLIFKVDICYGRGYPLWAGKLQPPSPHTGYREISGSEPGSLLPPPFSQTLMSTMLLLHDLFLSQLLCSVFYAFLNTGWVPPASLVGSDMGTSRSMLLLASTDCVQYRASSSRLYTEATSEVPHHLLPKLCYITQTQLDNHTDVNFDLFFNTHCSII